MTTPGPIERLEALDLELQEWLALQPDFLQTLTRRAADQFALRDDELDVNAFAIGQRSLADAVLARLRSPAHRPDPRDETAHQRFIERFCQEALRLHTDHVHGFWYTPGTHALPPRQWLMRWRHRQLQAEIELRRADKTLPDDAARMLEDFLACPEPEALAELPSGRRLLTQKLVLCRAEVEVELPGAFVISQPLAAPGRDRPVILVTLAFGIEIFDSLAALHQELIERLDDDPQGRALLTCLPRSRRDWALTADRLDFQPLRHNVFGQILASLLARQREDIESRWEQLLAEPPRFDLNTFSAALGAAGDLRPLLASSHLLHTRYTQIIERNQPDWMKRASLEDKVRIVHTMKDLALAISRASAPDLLTPRAFADREQLRAYAIKRLRRELKRLTGREANPDEVLVTVTHTRRVGPLTPPTNPSSSIPIRARDQVGGVVELYAQSRSLTELALDNLSLLDFDYSLTARVTDLQGTSIPWLNPRQVRRIIRQLDVGATYSRYLQHELLTSRRGRWRRRTQREIIRAQMANDAMKGSKNGSFAKDRLERGYRWARVILEHPVSQERPLVEGHKIRVAQLRIDANPVNGVYVISTDSKAVQSLVVYTMDAPDHKSWREYASRAELVAAWNEDPAMGDYLARRVNLADRGKVHRLLQRKHLGTHMELAPIEQDFFDFCYLSIASQVIADVDAMTVTTREMDLDSAWKVGALLIEVGSLFLPPPASGALALGRAFWSAWESFEALERDDFNVALTHYFEMLMSVGEAMHSMATSPAFAKVFRNLSPSIPLLTQTATPLEELENLRYRVQGIYAEGIFERKAPNGPPAYFIEDRQGRRYQVFFDGERWRVIDPNDPDAYYKPLVRRNEKGVWEIPGELKWHDLDLKIPEFIEVAGVPLPATTGQPGGVTQQDERWFIDLGKAALEVRPSLIAGRYVVIIPAARKSDVPSTVLVRRGEQGEGWEIKAKQAGVSSRWQALEW